MNDDHYIQQLYSTIKDRNLDGQYILLIRSDNPEHIYENNIPNIINEIIRYDRKGAGRSLASVLFASSISGESNSLCSKQAMKLALWILHNELEDASLPARTNFLEMVETGDSKGLIQQTLRGIDEMNDVVAYSAARHFTNLCLNKYDYIDYLMVINEQFHDLGGVSLSETSSFIEYIMNHEVEHLDRLIPSIVKRYAFCNPIGDPPQLIEMRQKLTPTLIKILKQPHTQRILSREEIHGASDGFIMLNYDDMDELVTEVLQRRIPFPEFFNILWLASLKRALLFDENNDDFQANKSLGWVLSISGITYLHAIKTILKNFYTHRKPIPVRILSKWITYAIWLILDAKKISLQQDQMFRRLDTISPLTIKDHEMFDYEKMVEYATHLYPEKAMREASGFAYRHPESYFEIVCQMINYLLENDNGEALVESSFLRLSSALIDMVKSNFATMLGSYSASLIALTLSHRTIFNFGRGHSRFELIQKMFPNR